MSADVQAGVVGFLRSLSVSADTAQLIVENKGVEALILAAKKHMTNSILQDSIVQDSIVQMGVAGALCNLAKSESDLNLEDTAAIMKGGSAGPSIVPGKPAAWRQ